MMDFKEAVKIFTPAANQGNASAHVCRQKKVEQSLDLARDILAGKPAFKRLSKPIFYSS